MKLIIAGSRDLEVDYNLLEGICNTFSLNELPIVEVISGGCHNGPDKLAKDYFDNEAVDGIFYNEFPADWDRYGNAAGPIRNKQMAEYADALLLIWDGESKGSGNMKKEMLKLKKPVYEVVLRKYEGDWK